MIFGVPDRKRIAELVRCKVVEQVYRNEEIYDRN
jgi:hypothetical protein